MTGCFQLENIHECQVYGGVWTNQRNYDGNCWSHFMECMVYVQFVYLFVISAAGRV